MMLVADGYSLCAGALDRVRGAEGADIAFGDESSDTAGPYYKPGWSFDLALEHDLVGGAALFRRGLLDAMGDGELEPPHDIVLRACSRVRGITHVPHLLSWCPAPRRQRPGAAAVRAALAAVVSPSARPVVAAAGRGRVAWQVVDPPPLVSVVIPTRDNARLLDACVDGLLQRTAYREIEVLIADNGSSAASAVAALARLAQHSRVTVVPVPGPFNYSAINNAVVAQSRGAVILLLNDDVEVVEPGWLGEMVGLAVRPDVGAVGAKLLYPDGRVQHAGIVLGVGSFEGGPGVAGHFGLGARAGDAGYAGQFVTTRGVSAVTGACLAVRRAVWDRVGGLDAVSLPVALNDLDFCLRVRAAGFAVVWTPHAVLVHHESASRGSDATEASRERFRGECRVMRERWGPVLDADPFYNPHFSRFDHSFQVGP